MKCFFVGLECALDWSDVVAVGSGSAAPARHHQPRDAVGGHGRPVLLP